VPLLRELLTSNNDHKIGKDAPHLYFLLGEAHEKSEDFVKSAQAYDEGIKILRDINKEEPTPDSLLKSAEAWYKARQYDFAAERHDAAIHLADKLGTNQYEDHLQRIRSYRFAGKRINALNALIDTFGKFPEKKEGELEFELKSLIDDFANTEELTGAAQILRNNEKLLLNRSDIKLVYERIADEILISAEYSFFSSRGSSLDALEARLNGLYGKPDSLFPITGSDGSRIDLSDEQKAKLLYLRAIIHRDNPKAQNLGEAVKLLSQAIELNTKRKDVFRYELGVTYDQLAQRSTGAPAKEAYLKAVVELESSLNVGVIDRNFELLRDINHKLNDDARTKTALKKALDNTKSDHDRIVSTARSLMSFCIDFIGDFKCGNDTASQLGNVLDKDKAKDPELELDIVEAQVLDRAYEAAEKRLIQIPDYLAARRMTNEYLPVTRFYEYWCGLALKREDTAKRLAAWEAAMTTIRSSRDRIQWFFDGALKFIQSDPENQLTAEQKSKLASMIEEMKQFAVTG
jgi:tetratricopeptide (TPR) repeat protein